MSKPCLQNAPLVLPAMVSNVAGIREKLRANIGGGATRKRDSDNARRGPLIARPVHVPETRTRDHVPEVRTRDKPSSLPFPKPEVVAKGFRCEELSRVVVRGRRGSTREPWRGPSPCKPLPPTTRRPLRRPTSLLNLLPTPPSNIPYSRPPSPSVNERRPLSPFQPGSGHRSPGLCPPSYPGLCPPSPTWRRPPSPGNGRRTPSPGAALDPAFLEVLRMRVRKVRAVRLYLLQRVGPHSFLVAADPPEHKYKVTIGPQSCTCGRGSHCIHVLFVMLRVLQVRESDHRIFARTLKNFEVEELTQQYIWRRRQQQVGSSMRRSVQRVSSSHCKVRPHLTSGFRRSTLPASRSESSLQEALKEKENRKEQSAENEENQSLCPICLLDMVEGESLVTCQKGCRNKLHYHCIAIWAEECRRQNENILCPLCRALWATAPGNTSTLNSRNQVKVVALPKEVSTNQKPSGKDSKSFASYRSSSPKKNLKARDSLKAQETQTWTQVFGREFVSLILSPHWSSREKGLKWLCGEVSSILSPDPGGGARDQGGGAKEAADYPMVVDVCCRVVAFMVTDPVYKVFIAALRVWRTLVSHSLCKTESDFIRLIELTKPIIQAVLLKCADGSRRTSQLSIATLVEMARGQSGAFAMGSQTQEHNLNMGTTSQNVEYLLQCALEDEPEKGGSWQWLLGRLALAERLMEEFPQEFYLLYVPSLPSALGESLGDKAQSCYKILNYDRLLSLIEFTKNALEHPHSTVNKMAHRIFIIASRFSVHIPPVFSQVLDIVSHLDASVQRSLLRKLEGVLEDLKTSDPWAGKKNKRVETEQERNLIREKLVAPEDSTQKILSKLLLSRLKLPSFGRHSDKKRPSYLPLHKTNSALLEGSKMKCAKSSQTSLEPSEERKAPNVTNDLIDLSPSLTLTSPCSPMSFGTEFNTPLSPTSFIMPWDASGTRSHGSSLSLGQEESWRTSDFCPVIPGLSTDNDLTITVQSNVDNRKAVSVGGYDESIDWLRGPLIGTGAFSSCYQARDVRTGTLMAVKQVSFYRNDEGEQEKVIKAIEEEIVMMVKLHHPNVLRILGATQQGGHYNVFVEWMAGGSVASLLDRYGAFSENVLLGYTFQVLDGLTYLHSNHILHRDLKGANLLVDSRGHHLRIADFGAAARLASQATVDGEFQGQLLGTIAFMAPEVLRGEDYGRSCDVWSVGCVIIEMATTKPPWNASDISNHLALIFKIACSKSPPAVPDTLSAETRELAVQCLQVASQDRPSARDLLQHAAFKRVPSLIDSNHNVSQATLRRRAPPLDNANKCSNQMAAQCPIAAIVC